MEWLEVLIGLGWRGRRSVGVISRCTGKRERATDSLMQVSCFQSTTLTFDMQHPLGLLLVLVVVADSLASVAASLAREHRSVKL